MTSERISFPRWIWLGISLVLAAGCASERSVESSAPQSVVEVSAAKKTIPSVGTPALSYLRVHQTNRVISLDIAVRRFTPARRSGPSIWLVGVTHIGEPQYYAQLQTFLASQKAVLFEGVRADSDDRPTPTAQEQAQQRRAADQTLQGSMARSLGLAFQLSAIDYVKPNFQHSDLSMLEIQELMQKFVPKPVPGERPAAQQTRSSQNSEFNLLLQAMDSTSWLNRVLRSVFDVLGSSPRMQTLSKLVMIRVMGAVGDELQAAGTASKGMAQLMEVLLSARNEKVLTDLKTTLKNAGSSAEFSVFYGAGHMKDMASRLQTQLHYELREERWMRAFSVDLDESGISAFEERMLESVVAAQIRSLGLTPTTEK